MAELLLLSNSTAPGMGFLEHATEAIRQVLGQLRMGQVSAEGHASQQEEPEENDLDRLPAPPSPHATQ